MPTQTAATPTEHRTSPASASGVAATPLLGALTALLPDLPRTMLLRAALHEGGSRDAAWGWLLSQSVDVPELFRSDVVGLKRLAPALHLSAQQHGEVPRELATIFRTAYLREELRAAEYGKILSGVLAAVDGIDAPVVLLTGAALGHTVYPSPILRHAHDIDVWTGEERFPAVIDALAAAGFSSPRPIELSGGQATSVVHDSLLPLLLHHRFMRVPGLGPDGTDLDGHTEPATLAGRPATVLRREPALLRALARAALCPHRAGLQWAQDAWHLTAGPGFDWTAFQRDAVDGQLAAPSRVLLGYLADELDLPVPDTVLAELQDTATRTRPFARDVLLFGSRHYGRGPGPLRDAPLTGAGRRALRFARWFPSRDYLRWSLDRPGGSWPALWIQRTLRSLRSR